MSAYRRLRANAILPRLEQALRRGTQTRNTLQYEIWGVTIPVHSNNLSHHIWRLNQLLKPMGERVKCTVKTWYGQKVATYRLVSCPPTLTTKPPHKTYDPEGLHVE